MTPLTIASCPPWSNPPRRTAGVAALRIFSLPLIVAFLFSACKNSPPPPLTNEGRFPQPVTYAVSLDSARKLTWPEPTPITSTQATLNFDKLPTHRFDSFGFQPFPVPPSDTILNWNSLPVYPFNLDSFPEIIPRFTTNLLAPPEITKINKPVLKNSQGEMVFDFGNPFNSTSIQSLYKARNGVTWIAQNQSLIRFDGENIARYKIPGLTSTVFDITEDQNGVLWICTGGNGLMSIDTKRGVSRQITSKGGLASNSNIKIMMDHKNRLWFSTVPDDFSVPTDREGGTVYVFDQSANKMKAISHGLSKNSAVKIFEDQANNIWIGTANGGVNIIDLKNNSIRYLRTANGLASEPVFEIDQDKTGRILVVGGNGKVNIINAAKTSIRRFTQAQGFPLTFTNSIEIDSRNNFWIAGSEGVRVIDSALQNFRLYNRASGLNGNNNSLVIEDNRQQMLLGNGSGLNLVRRNARSIRLANHTQVSTMAEDSHGRIWVGSLEKGIEIIDPATGIVKEYNSSNGLSNDEIQFILEFGGNLLVSTQKGGIEVIDTSLKKIERIGAAQGITDRNIYNIHPDNDNNIWIAGLGFGIDIIDVKNKLVFKLGPANGLRDSSILDLKKDRRGRMWFFSMTDGLGIIDKEARTVQYFKPSRFPSMRGALEENLLMHDAMGNTWFATATSGVLMFNPRHDSVTQFTTYNGLAHNKILNLSEGNGSVYIGTRLGLSILRRDSTNGNWDVQSMGRGSGIVKSIPSYNSDMLRRNGDYWWGDDGITIITNPIDTGSARLPPPTYITGMDILSRKQNFDAGPPVVPGGPDTIRTADSFYLSRKILALSSGSNEDGLGWDSVAGMYNMPVNLKIPYNKNYLQFHFAQLHLAAQDTTWYRYFFEGVDKNWSAITAAEISENYPNISPGKYSFKVSSLYKGRWSEPVSFDFTILPPWWKTWWAYLLYTAAALALLRAFVVYRSRALQRENKVLEEKVTLRTEQLQRSIEELKATQSQLIQSEKMASLGELTAGIAHEIQNPLNFVNNFSEINRELLADMLEELNKGNDEAVTKLVGDVVLNEEKISHHGRRADAIVKSMLQHSRGSGAVSREPTDLNKLADEYFRLAYHGLRAKDKSFNATLKTEFDSTLRKIEVMPNDFGRVILNLITNAFYAVAEKKKKAAGPYEPTVTVSSKMLHGKAVISVADNGNGIPQTVLDKIFQPFFTTKPTGQGTGLGLSLAYDIVKAHGGELTVQTRPGEGTVFNISIPVLQLVTA